MSRRDISDLKARLGLKKGGPAAKKRPGGVIAPPGAKSRPHGVPAPPGAQPPGPQIPAASEDPFAAMNAMAAVGVAQQKAAGPEIIVVNDGRPVENVETKSKVVGMVKTGAMILIPLIIGISVGQISKTAKAVNKTIEVAKVLHKDINAIRTGIQDNILNPLLDAKSRGDNNNFKPNDAKLTEALDGKEKLPTVDAASAFESYMFDLDKDLRASILDFYSQAAALNEAVEFHVNAAKQDAKLMEDGAKVSLEAKPDKNVNAYMDRVGMEFYRYGIYLEIPTQKEKNKKFGARFVEIGAPICQGEKRPSTTGKCDAPPIGFAFRTVGHGEGWSLKELGGPLSESSVMGDKLLPLLPTPIFESLLKGSKASVAEVAYLRRVLEIHDKAQALVKLGNSIEKQLKAKANQSKSFTFFL